jgi:arylsulfatase A-like enzyme
MTSARRASAAGGFLSGAMLGSVLGTLDTFSLLRASTVSGAPWRAFVLLALAIAVYAVTLAIAGAVLGALLPFAKKSSQGASEFSEGITARSWARTLAIGSGLTVFILAVWRMRVMAPDLSVFRLYCLPQTAAFAVAAAVAGGAVFLVARRVARVRRVARWLASPLIFRWTVLKLTALAVVLVAVLALEPVPAGRVVEAEGAGANVVLISIDTLRAGHLGYLGYERPTSPFADELAAQSVVFREALCQFPLTSPSQATILTSRYARSHGSTDNAIPIHDSAVLLSEVLQARGYDTAAFVTNRICGIDYGFARGFDYYVEAGHGDLTRSRLSDWVTQLRLVRIWWRWAGRERLTVAAARWLTDRPDGPFFLWYHQFVPHSPYAPPVSYEREWDVHRSRVVPTTKVLGRINRREVEISEMDLSHIVDLYDAEIRFTDDLLKELFDALRRNGLLDNTLVVFTADHGESLFDREGYIGHGDYLYDEEVVVPLFFYSPAHIAEPRLIEGPVETLHIAPTILEFLGLPPEPSFHGMSLWGTIADGPAGDGTASPAGAHSAHPRSERPAFAVNKNAKMVRFQGWKYILGTERAELYDLRSDPGELRNLMEEEPGRAAELDATLRQWDAGVPEVRTDEAEPDRESLELLRSLGYVD